MAGAAGSFVSRSFESMLKECSGRKYTALQKALQAYTGAERSTQPASSEKNHAAALPEDDIPSSKVNNGNTERMTDEIPLDGPSSTETGIHVIDRVTEKNETIVEVLSTAGHTLDGPDLDIVLQPLRLAFELKSVKLVELSLDCLHKLIAYDHLEGDPGLDGGQNAILFTDLLNMVCGCIDNSSSDSTILHVLKVLLTAVASTKFRVHGECLLGVIRICYNITLNSKNPINQATSKAMLTQMVNIIFGRMESDQDPSDTPSAEVETGEISASCNSEQIAETACEEPTEKLDEKKSLGDPLSERHENDTPLAIVEELQHLAGGADIKGLEAVLDKAVHLEDGKNVSRGLDLDSMSIRQRDALLLFRTLCKMSMKEENDEVATKTRLLSLELLQNLLEGVSMSFTRNFHFIDSVKAYLSYALLRASVSPLPAVFQHATGIFMVLLLRFRESLKGEIGVFFPLIILHPMDHAESLNNQRTSVLRMLEKVCKDPQMLADIFVNYDCDLEAANLFERMVHTLSRLAQGSSNNEPNTIALSQSASVKASSLQCLVNVIKSLVDWERSKRETADMSNNSQSSKDVLANEASTGDSKQEELATRFEKAKAHKSTMETAISEFNRKPGRGIEYLVSNKLVENIPAAVAHFLRNTPTLDKAMIGDYLGQHEGFPLAVMHAYVDSMNFSGLKFHTAIREFLGGFRLPGEAQKIDRIMEKFAERYCANNPGLFKNPDTAYVLAYAIIMLNTDAHNPMANARMSKIDFVRMNSSPDAEECAPKEILEEIYDSIVKEEIKLKDNHVGTERSHRREAGGGHLVSILNLALPRRKSASDANKESAEIVKRTRAFFRNQVKKRGIFYSARQIELARPMLEAVGWPLLAAFSVTMEDSENKPRVVLCMEGLRAGIHLTRVLGMDTMRYAFLTSLVRFTFLHAPKEMRSKNVEALRTLLALCDTETDSLQDTWNAVLECISRLEFITSTPAIAASVMQGSNQISRDAVLQSLKELSGKPAEQVFINTVKLDSDSVVEFFTALCGVSAEELKQSPARVFSLQKLVEISYYNMARIRMVWARIWSILSLHFISAGSHRDEKVAMYAIDSLRQLGMKYLERAELAKFTFQNDILKPFVVLMRNSRSQSIRGLIVDCIVQMIRSKVGSIKSGWRSVFMIFTAAAADDTESIAESAFENVEQVILEHFDQVVGDCFMDCVNSLIGFANNKTSARISLKAIALLRICEDRLAEGLIPGGALKPVLDGEDPNFDVTEHYWFPMLAGLSDLTSDPRLEVKNCALEVLFDLLNERGHTFSPAFWESIFHRVLFPIFDNVRDAGKIVTIASNDEWLRESSIHSLQLLCNLFNTFYKEVCFMLPSLLGLLLDCAKKTDQAVVSLSLGALVHLIEVGGHQFSDNDWDTLLISIRDATYTTQPLELLNSLGFDASKGLIVSARDQSTNKSGSSPPADSRGREFNHIHGKDDENGISNNRLQSDDNANVGEIPRLSVAPGENHVKESANLQEPEVLQSPVGKMEKASDVENLRRSQTFGQRIMGNMMDTLLLKNLTMKSSSYSSEALVPSSPIKEPDPVSSEVKNDENPLIATIRGKCITQLLLLGAIDGIQKKYWSKLGTAQKVTILDILLSVLDFAASYNSFTNLKTRMNQIQPDRPPINLLRQEMTGTDIYLDVLHKATRVEDFEHKNPPFPNQERLDANAHESDKLRDLAEGKLVSYCGQILKEASDLQSSTGDSANVDIHRVMELRSPVIVKVLKGMCVMNSQIFKRHLREFYPLITRLVCCDQMDIRGALSDLFTAQLTSLLP